MNPITFYLDKRREEKIRQMVASRYPDPRDQEEFRSLARELFKPSDGLPSIGRIHPTPLKYQKPFLEALLSFSLSTLRLFVKENLRIIVQDVALMPMPLLGYEGADPSGEIPLRYPAVYSSAWKTLRFQTRYLTPARAAHELTHAKDDLLVPDGGKDEKGKAKDVHWFSDQDPVLKKLFDDYMERRRRDPTAVLSEDSISNNDPDIKEYLAEGVRLYRQSPEELRKKDPGLFNYVPQFLNG